MASDLAILAKSENWNDQYFTDLEADVEVEGKYYPTGLSRRLGRASYGLRRVASLMTAIQTSGDQFMLVVGEPGSGKSVALRHFGAQLAQLGQRARRGSGVAPLYVNLRELPPPPPGGPTADFVRDFVLSNVRRGDSDTAAFLKAHWESYSREGRWFLLIDSFDEIPEVLSSPADSPVIPRYAEAVRQFLDGISACRGIVASRGFKSPPLPWHTLRILPLTDVKKDELIDNAFLTPAQKHLARQYVALDDRDLSDNPLFLALLCRYVREENRAPVHDYDLLWRHITRLASRDPDYTQQKYGLSADQLLEGGRTLAALLAQDRTLGLAPTWKELRSRASRAAIPGGNLENLLGALVYVKIGRSDVKEARQKDNRFAFSHRRYQEAFIVQHLAEDPSVVSGEALLTDAGWREYAVAFLQTQPASRLRPLLDKAEGLLRKVDDRTDVTAVLPGFGGHLSYHTWSDVSAAPLLSLLQEGLARRLGDVPAGLRQAVEQALHLRWARGDLLDRERVLELSGLTRQPHLIERIRFAVDCGSDDMRKIAFRLTPFVISFPRKLSAWLFRQLAANILGAQTAADVLRVEALSARLPGNLQAQLVTRRCTSIRGFVQPLHRAVMGQNRLIGRLLKVAAQRDDLETSEGAYRVTAFLLAYAAFAVLIPSIALAGKLGAVAGLAAGVGVIVLGASLTFALARAALLCAFRWANEPLGVRFLLRTVSSVDVGRALVRARETLAMGTIALAFVALPAGAFILMKHFVGRPLGAPVPVVMLYSLLTSLVLALLLGLAVEWADKRLHMARLKTFDALGPAAVTKASDAGELCRWLEIDGENLLPTTAHVRSLSRLLLAGSHRGMAMFDGARLSDTRSRRICTILADLYKRRNRDGDQFA